MPCDAFLVAYPAGVSSEHLPARVGSRVIEVVRPTRSVTEMHREVDSVRAIAEQPPTRQARRILFMWFRVFVHEQKRGKSNRVNVRIPIPIPIVGAFFAPGLSRQRALKALAIAENADDPAEAISDYLDSVMGFEFVRVDESKGPDHRSLVVVGFD